VSIIFDPKESVSRDAQLDLIRLQPGFHKSVAHGLCLLEATALLAGEPHSDHPKCACGVVTYYAIPINDYSTGKQRQRLRRFIPRLIGSRSKSFRRSRAKYLVRQAVTVFLPIVYDGFGQRALAAELRALPCNATLAELHHAVADASQSFVPVRAMAQNVVSGVLYARVAKKENLAAFMFGHLYQDTKDMDFPANGAVVRRKLWAAMVTALDGVLAIGPSGPVTLTPDMIERLKAYR
jgi:hypothetical protein